MPADSLEPMIGAQHHGQRVPADHAPDAKLHRLVAGEFRLLLRADGVDVARLDQRRQPDLQLPRSLEQLVDDESRPVRSGALDDRIERIKPLLGLGGIDVGQLLLELVEDLVHAAPMVQTDGRG